MRKGVYGRKVEAGRMTREHADQKIAVMQQVYDLLKGIRDNDVETDVASVRWCKQMFGKLNFNFPGEGEDTVEVRVVHRGEEIQVGGTHLVDAVNKAKAKIWEAADASNQRSPSQETKSRE